MFELTDSTLVTVAAHYKLLRCLSLCTQIASIAIR